ncbi:unnamed protein product [Closterium sp. NIES-53]
MALLMRLFACFLLILLSVSNVSGWKSSGSFDSVTETAQQGYQQQHRRVLNNGIATTSTPPNTPSSSIPATTPTSSTSTTPTSAEAVYQLALELIAVLLNDPTLSRLVSMSGVRFGDVNLPQIGNTLANGGGGAGGGVVRCIDYGWRRKFQHVCFPTSTAPLRSAYNTGQFLQCFKHNTNATSHCLSCSNCFPPI